MPKYQHMVFGQFLDLQSANRKGKDSMKSKYKDEELPLQSHPSEFSPGHRGSVKKPVIGFSAHSFVYLC